MTDYAAVKAAIIYPQLNDNQTFINALAALERMREDGERLDWLRVHSLRTKPITRKLVDGWMKGGGAPRPQTKSQSLADHTEGRSDAPAGTGPRESHKINCDYREGGAKCTCSRGQAAAGASADPYEVVCTRCGGEWWSNQPEIHKTECPTGKGKAAQPPECAPMQDPELRHVIQVASNGALSWGTPAPTQPPECPARKALREAPPVVHQGTEAYALSVEANWREAERQCGLLRAENERLKVERDEWKTQALYRMDYDVVKNLRTERDDALRARDLAREASNREVADV